MIKFYKKTNNFRTKFIICIVLIICAILMLFKVDFVVDANDGSDVELSQSVNDIVSSIDFDNIQSMADELNDFNLFNTDIKTKVLQILNGEYFTNYSSLTSSILSLLFVNIKEFLPILFTLIAIGILCTMLNNFKANKNYSSSDMVYFVCFAIVVIIILVGFKDILFGLDNVLNKITNQMQIIFPLLITMLTTIGSMASISIYNPLVSILTGAVSLIFKNFLYPIFILIFVLTIIGNLTETIKLDKFIYFLNSCFKWTAGFVFTIFMGFLSIQGISAGKFDSVSIKTTKFAMKSYIPIIGSYIAEGMDFLILGSVLVKNTIGVIGVMLIFVTIISPVINILIFKFGLQLTSAILDLVGASRLGNFIGGCAKILILPIVILIGISFMYIITIALIMCTANIF